MPARISEKFLGLLVLRTVSATLRKAHPSRSLATQRRTPVVVLSAMFTGTTMDGAQAVMQKPFDMDALLGRVSGLLALAH